MTNQSLKQNAKQLAIVNLIASKEGLILVTRNKSDFTEDTVNCWKLVTNLEDIIEVDEHGDAHIGGFYL